MYRWFWRVNCVSPRPCRRLFYPWWTRSEIGWTRLKDVGCKRGLDVFHDSLCVTWVNGWTWWSRLGMMVMDMKDSEASFLNQMSPRGRYQPMLACLTTCWGREKGCSGLCSPSTMAEVEARSLRGSMGMWEGGRCPLCSLALFPLDSVMWQELRLPDK